MGTILFLCTGNTCRSPMAEGFFSAMKGEKRTGLRAASAGLFTTDGMPASDYAVTAAKEKNADLSSHRSRLLNTEILEDAKFVFCMTAAHYDRLLERFPEAKEKAYLLSEQDITDPFGGDLMTYRLTANQLYDAVGKVLERLEHV